MAAPTVGLTGLVTSWLGTVNTALIGALDEHSISVRVDGGVSDRTPFTNPLVFGSNGAGLRSWSGTIAGRARLGTSPPIGYLGLVTFAGGYAAHVTEWNMRIETAAHDISEFGSAATIAGWRTMRPGLLRFSGGYSALIDATTALGNPFAPNTASSAATFTLGEESAVAQTLAGNIFPSALDIGIQVDALNTASYSFVGDGALTAAGASNIFAAGAVVMPEWDITASDGVPDTTLTVAATAGARTYAGPAFWKSISLNVKTDGYVDVSVEVQGAGALTPA